MLNEIKEIEEIINKLDIIKTNMWEKSDEETQEEYEERIKQIEDNIEEELIDAISESIINKQKIDEKEIEKETQEKINNDYELFSNAFIKDSDGTITLKSSKELEILGYNTSSEIEKLKEIQKNINDPQKYINKIKDSINESQDIDTEIERKMNIAKAIIDAKKRDETIPSNLEEKYKKDNFKKENEYIANTSIFQSIPVIQQEYLKNNTIIKNRYDSMVQNNVQTFTAQRHNLSGYEGKTAQYVFKGVETIKNIPLQKNIVYTNLEKKLDKTNDLTKQKIKARVELKTLFIGLQGKEIKENGIIKKEITEDEKKQLEQNIKNLKKKYKNILNDNLIDNMYRKYNVVVGKFKEESKKAEEIEQKVKPEKKTKRTIKKLGGIAEILGRRFRRNKCNIENNIMNKQEQNVKNNKKSKDNTQKNNKNSELKQKSSKINLKSKYELKEDERDKFNLNRMIRDISNHDNPEKLQELQDFLNHMDEFTGKDFFKNINNITGYFDIQILGIIYKLYSGGFLNKDGKSIIKENPEKANEYLKKVFTYFNYLEIRSKNKTDNPIKNIKNEVAYEQNLKSMKKYIGTKTGIGECMKKIGGMSLKVELEYLRRIDSNYNYKVLDDKIKMYEEKIKNNEKINLYSLDILGDIYYNGITSLSGRKIKEPDIIKTKDVYEKLINDYPEAKEEACYNRLLKIYKDNKLPSYDKNKAKKLEKRMKEKSISIESTNSDKSTVEKNIDCPATYVCSDLHGRWDAYQTALNQLKKDDKLYIIGDVIDRGSTEEGREKDGIRILQDVMKRKKSGQVEFLMGNHEYDLITTLLKRTEPERLWQNNDNQTRETYEKLSDKEKKK